MGYNPPPVLGQETQEGRYHSAIMFVSVATVGTPVLTTNFGVNKWTKQRESAVWVA